MAKAAVKLLSFFAGLLLALSAAAQQPQNDVRSARPLWSELSPKQQAILAPIAGEWDNLDSTRRKKWVIIANRYPKMTPDEQQRLQSRMQDWAALSPAERRAARENYQQLRQLPRAQRGEIKQKWQAQQPTPAEANANVDSAATAPGK